MEVGVGVDLSRRTVLSYFLAPGSSVMFECLRLCSFVDCQRHEFYSMGIKKPGLRHVVLGPGGRNLCSSLQIGDICDVCKSRIERARLCSEIMCAEYLKPRFMTRYLEHRGNIFKGKHS